MKKKTIASKVEKSWTALLVDGQGRIRRIRKFRQKLWAIVGLIAGTLILAAVMGTLYGGTLRKQMALSDEVDALRGEIVAIQQENELLKARAVRMEAQLTKPKKPVGSEQSVASVSQPAEVVQSQPASPSKKVAVAPPAVPATPEPAATPAVADKPKEKKDPQVDVEGLKIAYLADTEDIEARFVIKNTGQGSAGGRAVVVLHTEEGRSQLRFAVPSVPLRDGQPVGNRGRRFSISRFMTLTLKRKFAEPGTQFVGASVYAYTLEGKKLLEKTFDVTLTIPEKEAASDAVIVPFAPLDDTGAAAAPLGLNLPEPKPEEDTGAQP
jgi:microcystin-dependent protein